MYESYLGQKVNFNTLQSIAQAITAIYRDRGYILSVAELPAQRVTSGTITIRVTEGYIDGINIEGELHDERNLVGRMANKIKEARPLKASVLERYLLLIDDLPGVTARAVLSPATNASGASQLTITLNHKLHEGSIEVNNFGSNFLGPVQAEGVAAVNNGLGIFDRLLLRGLISSQWQELQYAEMTNEQQLNDDGLKLLFRAAITETEPGGYLIPLDLHGNSTLLEADVKYPLIRSRRMNLELRGGFNYVNSDADIANTTLYEDRIRRATLGAAFDITDRF